MKKMFLPIFLLLASPVFAEPIPNEAKQQLGQKVGQTVMRQDLESGAELVQQLFDFQEKYTEEKDQKWIQNKFDRLKQINGLEIPTEKDQLQFPLEENEQKTDVYEKSSRGGLLGYLGFGSTKKEISQGNSLEEAAENQKQETFPVVGPEKKPAFENENFNDLSQSTFFIIEENTKATNELEDLRIEQEKLETKQNKLLSKLDALELDLINVRFSIGFILDKSNVAKNAIVEKRKEKESAVRNQDDTIKALQEQLTAAQNAKNQLTQSVTALTITE